MKSIFFFFLVLWKINLSWGASRQHMPKFTNRDINKKRKETLLSTYDRTHTIQKVRILSKKIWKSYIFVIVHLWVKKLIIRVTYFLQIRVDWILQISIIQSRYCQNLLWGQKIVLWTFRKMVSQRIWHVQKIAYFYTVFENHRKSLIQHCERSELRLHWSILASFWKPTACGQTELPDMSVLLGQKLVKNAKIQKFKCDIWGDFQTLLLKSSKRKIFRFCSFRSPSIYVDRFNFKGKICKKKPKTFSLFFSQAKLHAKVS